MLCNIESTTTESLQLSMLASILNKNLYSQQSAHLTNQHIRAIDSQRASSQQLIDELHGYIGPCVMMPTNAVPVCNTQGLNTKPLQYAMHLQMGSMLFAHTPLLTPSRTLETFLNLPLTSLKSTSSISAAAAPCQFPDARMLLPLAASSAPVWNNCSSQSDVLEFDETKKPSVNTIWPRRKHGQEDACRTSKPVMLDEATVSKFFHLPLHKAAAKLGISNTAMKTACRKVGLKKWPYRTFIARAPLPSRLLHDKKMNHEASASPQPHESSTSPQLLPTFSSRTCSVASLLN